MDLNELIEMRKVKIDEMNSMSTVIETEQRKFSKIEEDVFENMKKEVESFDKQIDEKRNQNNKINKRKMENKFSLIKAIEARANGRSIEDYADILEAGKTDMRKSGLSYSGEIVLPIEFRSDILAGTQYQGQEIVREDKFSLLAPLRESLVLTQAGANLITGLIGDVSIPVYAGTSAAWKGEVVAAADGAGAFSEVTLSPKRLTAYIDISKQFLVQDSISAEQLLMSDIVNAVTDKLQETLLGASTGTTQPSGILYGVTDVTGTTGTRWSKIVGMEQKLREGNIPGPYSYIASPGAVSILKQSTGATAYNIILPGTDINGYSYLTSNYVTANHLVLANWNDMIIGQWGGFDLIVDPYTVAKEGKVRLVINTYWDAKFRRSTSYCVADVS